MRRAHFLPPRATAASGPIATEIHVRWHVGDQGKTGLVVLKPFAPGSSSAFEIDR